MPYDDEILGPRKRQCIHRREEARVLSGVCSREREREIERECEGISGRGQWPYDRGWWVMMRRSGCGFR